MRAKLRESALSLSSLVYGLCTYNFTNAIDRPTIHALRFVGRILNLQPRFDMFYRRGNETDRRSGHNSCNSMTKAGQCGLVLVFGKGCYAANLRSGEYVFKEQSAIQCQGAEHAILRVSASFPLIYVRPGRNSHRVHHHPSDQRRRRSLV